jgi:subtilase family serine protease
MTALTAAQKARIGIIVTRTTTGAVCSHINKATNMHFAAVAPVVLILYFATLLTVIVPVTVPAAFFAAMFTAVANPFVCDELPTKFAGRFSVPCENIHW